MQNQNPEMIKNASIGSTFSDIGGNLQFGNNKTELHFHLTQNTSNVNLKEEIEKLLKNEGLTDNQQKSLLELIDSLNQSSPNLAKILDTFQNIQGKIKQVNPEKNDKLKIWLDRAEQKSVFFQYISNFYEQGNNGTFIFCLAGNSENDRIEDASEMLQLYYFNDVIKNYDDKILLEKRVNQEINLRTNSAIREANKIILSGLSEKPSIFSQERLIEELEKENFKNKHIVARCKLCAWEEDFLAEFFNFWLYSINRDIEFPLFLIIEFSDNDFERLKPFIDAKFKNTTIALLPKLSKVISVDLDVFFARELCLKNEKLRYDSIFDRNSLTSKMTPLYYVEAITKLQLK